MQNQYSLPLCFSQKKIKSVDTTVESVLLCHPIWPRSMNNLVSLNFSILPCFLISPKP
jgi:hypothetical protein